MIGSVFVTERKFKGSAVGQLLKCQVLVYDTPLYLLLHKEKSTAALVILCTITTP